jgi:CHAT domain-containing protein
MRAWISSFCVAALLALVMPSAVAWAQASGSERSQLLEKAKALKAQVDPFELDQHGRLKHDYSILEKLKGALKLEEKAYGSKDPRLAETLERLADAYALANRAHQAKPAYKRLLALKRKTLGRRRAALKPYIQLTKTPLLKRTLALASQAEAFEKEAWGWIAATRKPDVLQKVFKQIKQTHSLLEKAYGKDDRRVERAKAKAANRYMAKARSILVGVGPLALDDRGDLVGKREVLEGLKAALALEEQAYGKDDPRVARTLERLGDAWAVAGDVGRTNKYFGRLLALKTQQWGEGDARLSPYTQRVNQPKAKRKALLIAKAASLKQKAEEIHIPSVGSDGYSKASRIFKNALRLEEAAYGKESVHLVATLERLADNLMLTGSGRVADKKRFYERILSLQEKGLKPSSGLLERTRNLLRAQTLKAEAKPLLGDTKRSGKSRRLALLKAVLALEEKVYGINDPRLSFTVEAISTALRGLGDRRGEARAYERFLSLQEGVYGADSLHLVVYIELLANSFLGLDFSRAEPLYERALRIQEVSYGPTQPLAFANLLRKRASLYATRRYYGKAESYLLKAKRLYERSAVADSARLGALIRGKYRKPSTYSKTKMEEMTAVLDGFQFLYWERRQYERATILRKEILDRLEQAHGPQSVVLAKRLTFYAHQQARGHEPALAEAWDRRALRIFQHLLAAKEKELGSGHESLKSIIGEIARCHRRLGNVDKAQALLEGAFVLNNPYDLDVLGGFFLETGQYRRAIPLLKKGSALEREKSGAEVPLLQQRLASAYVEVAAYDEAEVIYRASIVAQQERYGRGNRYTAHFLAKLAWLFVRKGEPDKAIPFYAESQEIWENHIRQMMLTGSEQDKRTLMEKLDFLLDMMVSVHLQHAPNNPAAVDLAATTLLRRKGRVLDAVSNTMAALRRRMSPQDRALLDELKEVRARLAKQMMAGARSLGHAEFARQVATLEEKARGLETAISKSNHGVRKQGQRVTLELVRNEIPAGAKLVELVRADKLQKDFRLRYGAFFDGAHYAAYVIGGNGPVQWANLGDADTIDQAVKNLRGALSSPSRADVKVLAKRVHDLVMKPLSPYLGDTTQVFIAPDGDLNLVPFGALVDERDRFLIERYSFTYLTSGRDLLRFSVREKAQSRGAIFANPRYDGRSRSGHHSPQSVDPGQRSHALGATTWSPLPGTATEAALLAKKLPGFAVYTDSKATESAIKTVQAPNVLHVATHGFFLPNSGAENPLLGTGLVFAGADQLSSGQDDGVLTGLEAAGMDLAGTELVVLSACETGLGEVAAGEGVYGLKRALVLAGARTQVLSLWKVADNATQALMTNYYAGLPGGDRIEAMRQVQLDMLKGRLTSSGKRSGDRGAVRLGAGPHAAVFTDWQHPYYWAAFTVSGAGGPIALSTQ